jgi:hypothetical protein
MIYLEKGRNVMEFRMDRVLNFHLTLDDRELTALYTLLQKLNISVGYSNKVKEFELTEDELNLIEWLDKYITHSDAHEELNLSRFHEEE